LYTSEWLFERIVPLSNNWIAMAYDRSSTSRILLHRSATMPVYSTTSDN
jgi:hypothetical protein